MEEIKPKKERKFLKVMGNIALTLFRELVLGIGKKVINKVGNKRQGLVIAFVILASTFAIAQFPNTGNKQRLGFQTTGDGLVWRGTLSDTASIQPVNNQNAWVILDTVNLKMYSFDFTSNVWNLVGGALTMPFDSIAFNTAKNGTVGVGEVEYNDTQGSLIQGLKGGNVTNVIGQQLHQRVNNRTGATLNKGDVVYLAGSQGNRITVAKGLAVTDAFSANTFGVVAESIPDNQSGFIITEGLITGLNTLALTEDSAVYLSPTVAGALTSTKPQAPQHTVYIGVCVKSSNGSGELFIKIRNGQELDELHDTRITNPVTGATLFYSGGLWRDTTAALLVSDTASMLSNYATKAYADTTGRLYARQDYTSGVTSSTLTWTQSDTLIPGGVNVVQVYRNGQILLPSQYTIPTSTSVVIAASSFKVNDNYTIIFPRGGGAGSGGGSGSLTSISAGTGITVSPNPITTTGTVSADLSVLMELTDTSLLNLTTRFASKLNTTDTASLSNRIDAKGTGTVTSVGNGYGLLSTQSPITTSGVIRVDSNTVYNYVRDSIVKVRIGNDTIKILKQEYNNVTTDTLTWTTTNKFPIQLRAFILLFRNGQLLINDQYSVIDTNKIKIAATSYKVGENYTLVTVSGIGSAGVSQTGNPVYPDAGIALSTGTTWASSITNNSSNWNTAFTDRLKWDGGSTGLTPSTGRTSLGGTTIGQSMFTLTNPSAITFPRFNADNTVDARTAANFRSDIGAGTVTSVNVAAGTPLSIQNNTTIPEISMAAATGSINGYLTSIDWNTFNNKQNALSNASSTVSGILTSTDWTTFNNKQNALSNASSTVSGILTSTDWNTFNNKQNALTFTTPLVNTSNTITINQSSGSANGFLTSTDWTTFNNKQNALSNASSTVSGILTSTDWNTFNNKQNALSNASSTVSGILTSTDWNTFNNKQNQLTGTGFVKASGTSITYDNSTYLTTGTAASTYLPLTGGTLTGVLTGTTGTFTGLNVNGLFKFGGATNYLSQNFDNGGYYSEIYGTTSNNRHIRFQGLNDAQTKYTSINLYAGLSTIMFKTDEFNKMELTNNLLVINEDSQDTDFRVESDGNANMLFVDASTDRVGIGTNAPTKTLDVNGTLGVTGATTLSNLAGTGTRMVVAASDGLLSTQAIQTERYYINLGIVAGAADNSASTYDYSYPANIFIVPTSLNGYCIDSVYIRAIGCSTCPPVSPDLDYYVGVYKANAGARVTTSGATLVGSQITMNEYDLNQVNRNDTLSTGEAWWVYLNGTYTSDMAYITAGFVVKKTCN